MRPRRVRSCKHARLALTRVRAPPWSHWFPGSPHLWFRARARTRKNAISIRGAAGICRPESIFPGTRGATARPPDPLAHPRANSAARERRATEQPGSAHLQTNGLPGEVHRPRLSHHPRERPTCPEPRRQPPSPPAGPWAMCHGGQGSRG